MKLGILCGWGVGLLLVATPDGKTQAQSPPNTTKTTVVNISHTPDNTTVVTTTTTVVSNGVTFDPSVKLPYPGKEEVLEQKPKKAAAPSPAPSTQDTEPQAASLSAEGEKKLAHFISGVIQKRAKVWMERMTRQIANIAKLTNLSSGQVDALKKAAEPIVNQYSREWAKDTEDALRHSLLSAPTRENDILDQLESASEMIALNDEISDVTPPSERDEWTQAVHTVLTSDQSAVWDKDRAEKRVKFEADLKSSFEPAQKAFQSREYEAAMLRCHEIEGLNLSQDQKKKLEAAAKLASEQSADKWKARTSDMVFVMESPAQKAFLGAVNNFRNSQGDFVPDYVNQPAWKSALTDVLTSDQREKMNHLGNDESSDRAEILGVVLIAILDEKIGFTSAQRDQLKPISDSLVKSDPVLCPKDGKARQFSVNYLYDLAKKASDSELAKILDSAQIARWGSLNAPSPYGEAPNPVNPPAKDTALEIEQEPEHVEEVISQKMYASEQNERKSIVGAYSLKAEEVIRVTNPGAELSEKLRIAVLGMSERQLASWKSVSEQQLRNQLSDVSPDTIDEKLPIIQRTLIRFGPGQSGNGVEQQWENVLKATFSAPQLQAVRKDISSRQEFLASAASGLVLSDFGRQFSLDKEQRAKMKPLLEKVMQDYAPDIPFCFYQGVDGTPWFLTPSFEYTPVMGVSDTDLKGILNADQQTSWTNSNEHANGAAYWQQFQQVHQSRIQNTGNLNQE